jgi:hypothetical protein
MKILNFNGEKYMADKIIKTENSIIGQDSNGNEVFAFKGISDFGAFAITNEDGTITNFDMADTTIKDTQEQISILNNNFNQFVDYVFSNVPNLPQ